MAATRVDTILEIKDHIAAYVALLSGQFDDEIKKIEELKAILEQRLSDANALDGLSQAKAEADAYCARSMADAESAIASIKVAQDAMLDERNDLLSKQKALTADRQQFNSDKNDFDVATAALRKEMEGDKKAAKAALAEAKATNNDAKDREDAVAKREAEVARKLEVLKSI